jgi:transcriptional regulator with XRE-family HTH domain
VANGDLTGTVKDLREELGLTQQEFASLMGLSIVSISRWEHGHTEPTSNSKMLIGLLCRALNQKAPSTVLQTLQKVQNAEEIDRIIALVHLGDR